MLRVWEDCRCSSGAVVSSSAAHALVYWAKAAALRRMCVLEPRCPVAWKWGVVWALIPGAPEIAVALPAPLEDTAHSRANKLRPSS
jgi:hypothetical protein